MINPNIIEDLMMDGWKQVFVSGTIYCEFWDDGQFIIRCPRAARDNILAKAGLPLKSIGNGVEGILTDF